MQTSYTHGMSEITNKYLYFVLVIKVKVQIIKEMSSDTPNLPLDYNREFFLSQIFGLIIIVIEYL